MSIFNSAESAVGRYRSLMPLKDRNISDVYIGRVTPLYAEFAIPHDIHHIRHNCFIRTQAMLAPMLTDVTATIRSFFIPLRLIEEDTELIITGSKNGKFSEDVVIPTFKNIFADAKDYVVEKYSILDYMLSMPLGDYSKIKDDECLPAQYWLKAWARVWFDWYRDENLSSYSDFEKFWDTIKVAPGKWKPWFSNWRKDYFTSSLPWQQKGVQPAFDLSVLNPTDGTSVFPVNGSIPGHSHTVSSNLEKGKATDTPPSSGTRSYVVSLNQPNVSVNSAALNTSGLNIDLNGAGGSFTMPDLRILGQTQRIFERLARCGSRYTEYLYSNFGIAPADGTLQRAQYLGGFTQPIVTSEVVQSAEDSSGGSVTPVGTLRGKGISMSGSNLETFIPKEFGVIISCLSVMPKPTYSQGIPRKYTFKRRFDFFNPSFQNLSEQQVRNGEVYVDLNPAEKGINDKTFGFEEMYSELKFGRDRVSGDMRGTQSYWTMVRYFSSTPKLSEKFVTAQDSETFTRPFAITDRPQLIVEFGTVNMCYRPMTKYGTPGLVDHS